MKKEFLAIVLFLIISNIAVAQQPGLGGVGSSGGGTMHRPTPNVTRAHPSFIKGEQSLAETWDATIAGYGNAPDGMTVNCFAEDSDNLYIGGDFLSFDTVASQFIVQYNRKTGVWSSLAGGFNNEVYSLAVHNDTLYAAGSFGETHDGSGSLNYIAMWDGTSWQSVGGGMNDVVNSIAFIGDTLYAGGAFSVAGGVTANNLAYWDGQTWNEAFGGTSYPVNCLFSTHDSLFVGGNFNYVGSGTSNTGQLALGTAMLQNGTWTTFAGGAYCSTIAVFDGELWAAGDFYGLPQDGPLVNDIAYWDGTGWNAVSGDTSVGTDGTGPVNQLLVVGDTLLALGQFGSMAGVHATGIAMFKNGTWSQVAGGLYGYGKSAIPFDGKLFVGGRFTKAGTVNAMSIASLSKGTWDSAASIAPILAGWASAQVRAIATTNRYVFIGGAFTTIAGKICNHVAAYDKQRGIWTTLGDGVDGDVYSLAVSGDNLFVGGFFNQAGTIRAVNIAEYNIATAQWSAMGTGARRSVSAIAVDASGAVYAPIYNPPATVGSYYDFLGVWNGTSWSQFGNGLSSGYIQALTWQGSTLFAAGSFSTADDGTKVNGVAQLQNDFWGGLSNGLNDYAYALAVSGDSLYVGGVFTQADGQPATSLAVWNGNDWNPIGTGFNNGVYALTSDGNGGVYVGGQFTTVAGISRGDLVHWNGSAFGSVSSGVNNTVSALATDASALYAGGWFDEAGSTKITSLHFGALNGAGVSAVALSAQIQPSLSIYPNPASASSNVSLVLSKPADIRLELFNTLGEKIDMIAGGHYEMGTQNFSLDTRTLSSGIYFLRLTGEGTITTEDFVIEHE